MDEKEIELKYNRRHFEEIYFRNGGDKTFFHKRLKKERTTVMAAGIVFILIGLYAYASHEKLTVLIIPAIILGGTLYDLYRKVQVSLKWKNDVKIYLNELDGIKTTRMLLSKNTFCLVQDTKETIEK